MNKFEKFKKKIIYLKMSKQLIGKYKVFPITLYRLQQKKVVKLREMSSQLELGKSHFDFTLKDGMVHPNNTDKFIGPNGMSLLPLGQSLSKVAKTYNFSYIYEISAGAEIPDDLILLHEHTDHYSLQTSIICSPNDFDKRLTLFLQKQKSLSKDDFLKLV